MYKVFINNYPIFLTSRKEDIISGSVCLPLDKADMDIVVKMALKNPGTNIFLYHPKPDKLLKKLNKKLPLIVAAGGMVRDKKGRVLFIKRNGKWDLPKGGVEKGETIEDAAVRETREETGVTGLRIIRPLAITRHIFNRNSRIKLKETHWFAMETDFSGDLKPQTQEGIEKVRWKDEKATQKALGNAYGNVVELFS